MILSTLVASPLHFEMCAGLYGHPVFQSLKASFLAILVYFIEFEST